MQDVLLKINGRGILWQNFDDIQELLVDLPTAEITFGRPKAPWHAMAMATSGKSGVLTDLEGRFFSIFLFWDKGKMTHDDIISLNMLLLLLFLLLLLLVEVA